MSRPPSTPKDLYNKMLALQEKHPKNKSMQKIAEKIDELTNGGEVYANKWEKIKPQAQGLLRQMQRESGKSS